MKIGVTNHAYKRSEILYFQKTVKKTNNFQYLHVAECFSDMCGKNLEMTPKAERHACFMIPAVQA
jgi:hypothetical protein